LDHLADGKSAGTRGCFLWEKNQGSLCVYMCECVGVWGKYLGDSLSRSKISASLDYVCFLSSHAHLTCYYAVVSFLSSPRFACSTSYYGVLLSWIVQFGGGRVFMEYCM